MISTTAGHPGRPRLLAAAILSLTLLSAAGPPEVVRVRVPRERVASWFPPGTELLGMPREDFEALARDAKAGFRRASLRDQPRLLRARHDVRWRDGQLVGRSELLIEGAEAGRGPLPLVPWTPAILHPPEAIRSGRDGRTSAWVEPGAVTTLVLEWELRSRAGSDGRTFALALPRLDAAALTLDLPADWVPDGPAGVRQGPAPGSDPSRRSWRFDGPGGWTELSLRSKAEGGAEAPSSRPWVGGPTRVELDDAAARWRADWTVDPGPGGPRRLAVLLDPGLEPIDATGPNVVAFRSEPAEGGTRLTIRLADETTGPTPLTIQARAPAPVEGRWSVPSARPLDAHWIGGETTIRLGPARALDGCRALAGLRVSPRPEEATEPRGRPGLLMAFEASRPESVAELTFARPEADASAEVRGWLALEDATPRAEATVSWRAHRGRPPSLIADVSPGWAVRDVRLAGTVGGDPPSWRAEPRRGGTRLTIRPPPFAEPAGTLALVISAVGVEGRGPLPLPRIRASGAANADESWVVLAGSGLDLRPEHATGLAWVDPATLPPLPADAPKLEPALAWRWTGDEGAAWLSRERPASSQSATFDVTAAVVAGRLKLDARIRVEGNPRLLPIWFAGMSDANPSWRLESDRGDAPLPARPLDDSEKADRGLPVEGPAWEIDLSRAPKEGVVVRAVAEHPWPGRGRIPLPALPDRFHARGTVRVEVESSSRSDATGEGLRALDPDQAGSPDEARPSRLRVAHAFGFEGTTGRLLLKTEALEPAASGGLIRQATLTTRVGAGGIARQRLTLRVEPAAARTLGVTLPGGARPEVALLDGRAVTPARRGEILEFPLPEPRPGYPSSVIVVDYPATSRAALLPEAPVFSMPCLALDWEVARPEPWAAEVVGPALVRTDPGPATSWPTRVIGAWPRWWSALPPSPAALQAMAELDVRVADGPTEGVALRDLFTRWDAGKRPLVIDRVALAAAGMGPDSRSSKGADRTANGVLRPLGLAAVPVGGMLLITTPAEVPDLSAGPDAAESWARALRAGIATGSDPSDRFQSASRWRNEPPPDKEGPGEGPPALRFTAPGWPGAGSALSVVELRARASWCWALGLAVLTLGIAVRHASLLVRSALLSATWMAALLVEAWAIPALSSLATAVAFAAMAVALYWLGRSARARAARAGGGPASQPSGLRSRPGVIPAAILGLIALGAAAAEDAPADGPILALIPFEGTPALAEEGTRVVLRLADHDRLRAWADAGKARTVEGLGATTATHTVRPEGDRGAAVESRYELRGEGEGPWSWSIPLGASRDVSATLDGQAAPILIRPGGQAASVEVAGAGRHELAVRRLVDRQAAERGGPIDLPINPVGAARVAVGPTSGGLRGEVIAPRGLMVAGPAGVGGALGPVERLEVRWPDPGQARAADEAGGPVDAALLWDATPAGDRLRARLTFHNPSGTATVRLAMEPGFAVHSARAPGLIEARMRGPAERPEWVARFEPPLGDGEFLSLDCWRPTEGEPADARRHLPRLSPVGVERYSGVLGFRHPAEWSGRLGPVAETEPVADEAFVRAWGDLPRDLLALAGALRFSASPTVEAGTGPPPARPSIRQDVDLRIEPGRVEVLVDAALSGRGGPCFEAQARVPEALRLVRVEAEGLTYWTRPEPGLVRLRFDGPEAPRRSIRLEGWMPAECDPMAVGPVAMEAAVPWPRWVEVEEEPGTLAIASPVSCRVADAVGFAPAEAATATAALPTRLAFRAAHAEAPGVLRWSSPAPRVDVSVRSLLTIDPGTAEWAALVDYRVVGGSADVIRLKLPEAWSRSATVRVEGGESQVSTRPEGGAVVWSIRPGRRIWSALRVVVRSGRPIQRGENLVFPDLVPLGQGTVETLLALADRSGWGVVPGGSPGLQPISTARFHPEDFRDAPATDVRDAFLVRREGWSLRVRMGDAPDGGPADPGGTRLASADLTCVASADGTTVGEARYEVGPRPGPFLEIRLPSGAEALGARVEGRPVAPLRWSSGRWLIPLGGGRQARPVIITWRGLPSRLAEDGRRAIALPVPGQPRVPEHLTVYTPESSILEVPRDVWRAVPGVVLEVEGLERSGRRIADRLGEVDRGSSRGRAGLVKSLMEFELAARGVERSVAWGPPDRALASAEVLRRMLARVRDAREGLADALGAAGLDDLDDEARAGVGLLASTAPPRVPAEAGQLRRPGKAHHFRGESRATDADSFRLALPEPPPPWRRGDAWALVLVGLAAIPMVIVLARHGVHPVRFALMAPSIALAAWALGVEASALTALFAAAVLGWATAGPRMVRGAQDARPGAMASRASS